VQDELRPKQRHQQADVAATVNNLYKLCFYTD